jgi:Cdc6-like AAA superfamily ATPase
MSKNQSKQNDIGLDFVSPIVEIFTMILEEIIKLLGFLLKIILNKLTQYVQVRFFDKYTLRPIKMKELKSKKKCERPDSIGYSINHQTPFYSSKLNTKKHTAIIGATGSGKTVCSQLLIEHALKRGMPVIYFDPKASHENIATFRKICEMNNKKLYVFSDISESPVNFNPLSGGNLGDISDKIINALDWSEPFYKNESIEALDSVLQALTFSSIPITLETIIEELKKHKNFKNIKGLYNQLNKVVQSEYGSLLNSTSKTTLTFNQLRIEDACLYIGISAMGHSSSGNILNKIFFGGLLTHAKESLNGKVPGLKNPLEEPISIFFDELSSTIHSGFIDLQNKCRQAGMEITYATQGPADIDRISPTLTAQIFENTNNLFIFNQIVPAHTEFFARMFGTINTEKRTHVIDEDQKQDRGSVREVEEFLVHSNILRNLKVGQCVFLQRGPKRIDLLNVRHWKPEISKPKNKLINDQAQTIF